MCVRRLFSVWPFLSIRVTSSPSSLHFGQRERAASAAAFADMSN